jgi:metal-dependent hydrolase (beta-lactamase superfamily II)
MSPTQDKNTPFAAPVVDRLSVRVVVDSHYERFLPKATHQAVAIEHVGAIPGRPMTTLAGEWGLSLHLESEKAGAKAQYLLDFGYTPEIVNRNFALLDIEPARLNGLILSHGHRDHYGGLAGFVTQHRHHMRSDLALYVGAENVFREKWVREAGGDKLVSMPGSSIRSRRRWRSQMSTSSTPSSAGSISRPRSPTISSTRSTRSRRCHPTW